MIFGSRWGFFWSLKPFTQLSRYEISFVILLGAKDGPDGHLLVLAEPMVVGGFHMNSYFFACDLRGIKWCNQLVNIMPHVVDDGPAVHLLVPGGPGVVGT